MTTSTPGSNAAGDKATGADGQSRANLGALSFIATRPVAISMFMVALMVFGWVSLEKLPMDLLPEISYPTLTVRTSYPGAAPEDVEDRVSVRLQEALSTLTGLVRSTSVSRAGFSDVVLEFDWGTNMTFAVQDVRDRTDGVFLPSGADRPLILRYDPNLDPILRFGISAPLNRDNSEGVADLIQLRWLAEKKIKRDLEGLEGVAAVQVRGGLEEEIVVSLDPFKMAAQGLDPSQVTQRLAQENLNASGGQIREGSTDFFVRTLNEFQTIEEIRDLAIVRRGDAAIRLRDIANVRRTHAEREVISTIGGYEAVEIAIYREAGANIVDVAQRVKDMMFGNEEQQELAREKGEEEKRTGKRAKLDWGERNKLGFMSWILRRDAGIQLLSDQSTFIRAAVEDVRSAAILGGLLSVLVILVFLRRLSATLIIAVAIPISVLVTFAPMFILDVSLNIMSLGGLALGVGMLVDNAIVVLESITRCREEGDDVAQAAVRGVTEVAGAITASTLTTVAVFAPIVFVHGIAGQIFGDQAVAVVSSLLVSLLVAVLVIPMLAARGGLGGDGDEQKKIKFGSFSALWRDCFPKDLDWTLYNSIPNILRVAGRAVFFLAFLIWRFLVVTALVLYVIVRFLAWPLRKSFDLLWGGLDVLYPRVLSVALSGPMPVIVLIGAGLLTWHAVGRLPNLGMELLPEIHQGEFTAHVGLSVGTPIEQSEVVFRGIDRTIRALEGVQTTALTVGVEQDTLTREIEGEHTARLTVRLKPEFANQAQEMIVLERVRAIIERQPEVRSLDVKRPTPFALDAPIAVEIRGYDLELLAEVADRVRARLESMDALTDVRTSVRPGHPEARVTFDRDKTLEYGLDLATVSALVRDQVLGVISTRFVEGDERIDVRVRGDRDILKTLADVMDLAVNPTSDTPVPLRAVADIRVVQGPAEIRRIGNSRAVVVTATNTGGDLGGITTQIEMQLRDMVVPEEVSVELGGQKREMDEGMASLKFALLLAIFLVYVVMASQFESLIQPLVILFSLPLAAVGVIYTLELVGLPLSVVVFIGLILLAGIVVNNAIVLVDRINSKRRQGLAVRDAVLEAGRARLRPILMTTATTVLGLIPLTGWLVSLPLIGSLGAGEGSELRAPMAITVIAGLTSSTLLTLLVIPVLYSLVSFDRKKALPVPVEGESAA